MTHRRARLHLPTEVLSRVWRVADTTVTIVPMGWARLAAIDAAWRQQRDPADISLYWSWAMIFQRHRLVAAVVASSGETVALFSSRPGLVELASGKFLRIDRLEVAPTRQRTRIGSAVIALVAFLAEALGANGLLLATDPTRADLHQFYAALGGTCGEVAGWQSEPGLVPWQWSGEAFALLVEAASAYRV